MPEAEGHRETPAIPTSAASSSAPPHQSSNQNRTTQQGESARTSHDNPDAQELGSESQNNATLVPEECRKMLVIASYHFPKSDPTDWYQESLLTKPTSLRNIRFGNEFVKAVKQWWETKPPNPKDLLQFLEDCAQNKNLTRIFWALEGPSTGEENELTVQMLVPEDIISVSNEAEEESNALPLKPVDATSSSEQVQMKRLTFDKALTIVTEHKALKVKEKDDDVTTVKAQSEE
jgi:hypothetical protein